MYLALGMLVLPEQFPDVYNNLKKEALKFHPNPSILIFVAADADAVCSCRILTTLLCSDFIPFELAPVTGYHDIIDCSKTLLVESDRFIAVVMINCGANMRIYEEMKRIGVDVDNFCFYLIDSHRPLALTNVYSHHFQEDNVVVFATEQLLNDEKFPSLEDYEAYLKSQELDASDESTTENELTDTEEAGSTNQSEYEDINPLPVGSSSSHLMHENSETSNKRRKGLSDSKLDHKRHKQESKRRSTQKTLEYLTESYYGVASSFLMYNLALSLNKENNSLLWLGIIGLSEQRIFDYIDSETYQATLATLRQEVSRMNADDALVGACRNNIEEGSFIKFEEELPFVVVRHWTLYDSMVHSRYIATRLNTWKESGIARLNTLLVKMGLSLKQCKQKYSTMHPLLKSRLKKMLKEYGATFHLHDPLFPSFYRLLPHQGSMSASDFVYSINALLTAPCIGKGDSLVFTRDWIRIYFRKKPELILEGLKLAIEQHRFILSQVSAILEQRVVFQTRPLRHAYISTCHPMLSSPLILTTIALFLLDIYREAGLPIKPFIVWAAQVNSDTALVVGVAGMNKHGDLEKNTFGQVFERAAQETKSTFRHDNFNTSPLRLIFSLEWCFPLLFFEFESDFYLKTTQGFLCCLLVFLQLQ
ncbi:cell division control protein 45 homolog isoform X3 [Zophobas morio]|uniref:cell division control protein 45 homolog isoform X3 n=1 Tax=Zophobas morio TaxID=2755281 RepID=UPI00308272D6